MEASNKVPSEDSSHKTVGEVPGLALYMDSSDKTLSKMDPVKSPNKPSCESTQVSHICFVFGHFWIR